MHCITLRHVEHMLAARKVESDLALYAPEFIIRFAAKICAHAFVFGVTSTTALRAYGVSIFLPRDTYIISQYYIQMSQQLK